MKKLTKIMSLLLIAVLVVMSFTACGGDKGEIKSLIETYQKAGIELDLEKAQSCLDPECEQYAALAEGLKGGLTESLAQMGLEEAQLKNLLKDYGKLVETEIKDIKVVKETATATLVTKTPDMDSMSNEVMDEFMTAKKLTQADLMAKVSSQEAMGELMIEMVEWMIKEKAPKLDKLTETKTISLKKIDGKWLISNIEDVETKE